MTVHNVRHIRLTRWLPAIITIDGKRLMVNRDVDRIREELAQQAIPHEVRTDSTGRIAIFVDRITLERRRACDLSSWGDGDE